VGVCFLVVCPNCQGRVPHVLPLPVQDQQDHDHLQMELQLDLLLRLFNHLPHNHLLQDLPLVLHALQEGQPTLLYLVEILLYLEEHNQTPLQYNRAPHPAHHQHHIHKMMVMTDGHFTPTMNYLPLHHSVISPRSIQVDDPQGRHALQ
jgi:hypothetical protein